MRKVFLAVVVTSMFGLCACTENTKEIEKKTDLKKNAARVHGETVATGDNALSFIDVVKRKDLPIHPGVTIGKMFDDYSWVTNKQWRETRGLNGTYYIDFSGWFGGNASDKKVSSTGINVKFVINTKGNLFVGMVSKLEMQPGGEIYSYPQQNIQSIMEKIYANREIGF